MLSAPPHEPAQFKRHGHLMKILVALLLSLLGGCVAGEPSHDVVARSFSPDGAIDAVLVESNGGATTSFWYDVCLARHGGTCTVAESIATIYGATRSDQAYGVNVHWVNDSLLEVRYLDAVRTKVADTHSMGDRMVKIVLRPGVRDDLAPPGGMLYNLQNRRQDAP
jgi:hypothetical protein